MMSIVKKTDRDGSPDVEVFSTACRVATVQATDWAITLFRIKEKLFSCSPLLGSILAAVLLAGCSSGGSSGETSPEQDLPANDPVLVEPQIIPSSQVRPFVTDGPYADVLKDCVFPDDAFEPEDICTLGVLPFIGQTTDTITTDDILDRTLVTHDWMGVRLGELLNAMPADLLPLFAPVTTVLIGSEVRPSSFNTALGRMKIDADHLWMSVDEKRTVSQLEDFRTNFGADLQFVSYWRLMRGEDYAIPFSSLTDESTREFNSVVLQAARPLYHELAHANDLVRPQNIDGFSSDLTPNSAAGLFPEQRIAELLYDDASLTTQFSYLYPLARVRFADEPPTDNQKTYLADFVGSEMGNEGKQTFYGYFTIFEDVATLFAQTMLRYHYGIETHVAFMNKPANEDDALCDDYIVDWGVKNRIASPLVAPRAKFVTELLIGPSAELDTFFASTIGQQTPLATGIGWCESRFDTLQIATERSRNSDNDELQFSVQKQQAASGH